MLHLKTVLLFCLLAWIPTLELHAQEPFDTAEEARDVLSPERWEEVEEAVDRGLLWLASEQLQDGSFPTRTAGQPGVTSLCGLAFMSAGHAPGIGRYGEELDKAIDFVLATQREDGLFSHDAPNTPVTAWHGPTHTAMYNHPIAGLLLTEAYGMVPGTEEQKDLKQAIERGIKFTLSKQLRPGPYKEEDGGWGYLRFANEPGRGETDLSVTGWHMMFLRSAKNAGFEVPDEPMQAAAKYVIRCFEREGTFVYGPVPADRIVSRGMTGAGILSLGMAGQHKTPQARKAADWLLKHPVDKYNVAVPNNRMDRFHYGVHYASHGMYQLGGKHWKEFYPTMAGTMLSGQTRTGAWPRDSTSDRNFGAHYSSALAILSLTPPYQLLSIYQR